MPEPIAENPLKILADMAALFADPAKLARQIKEFQHVKAAAEKAEASLAGARAKHDDHVRTTTADLDRRRGMLAARELDLTQREGRLEASAKNLKDREEALSRRSGRAETFHSGMTREFVDTAPDRPDPHYGSA
jgi:hypothetical protein